jgi:CBS domain containing-hemolysin-like protein
MSALGRLPVVGDTVQVEGEGTLKVERLDGRRVDRLRFTPDPDPEPDEQANARTRQGSER